MIKNIISIAIVVFLLSSLSYVWIQKENKEKELIVVNGKVYELLSKEVEVVEVEKIVTEFKEGKTIYVEVEVPVEVFIPTEIDTMEVLQDYYSTRVYSDTLRVENLGYVTIVDTISQNKIIGRSFKANLLERTVTETITVKELPRLQIWTGITASNNMQLGATIGITTKRRTHLGLDVGVILDDVLLSPYVGVRYLWQIR